MTGLLSKKNILPVLLNISTIVIIAIMLMINQAYAKPDHVNSEATFSSGVLSYQGTLMDANGNPLTGSFEMTFGIYNAPSGGTPLWEEHYAEANEVQVQNGLFKLMLGSLNPIPDMVWESTDLFLGIRIGSDDELSPREKVTIVPTAAFALSVPDGSITIEKLGEQPYYFYGAFATPTEWMADVIFNGNYSRFCDAIGRTFSRAETLQAHYTEYPTFPRGKGNGFFYQNWFYVGTRLNLEDIHVYGNGNPEDPYNVWKVNSTGYSHTMDTWTYERSALIWCK